MTTEFSLEDLVRAKTARDLYDQLVTAPQTGEQTPAQPQQDQDDAE